MNTGERAFQVYRTWVRQWQAARRAELRAERRREIERIRMQREDPRFLQALARHRAAVHAAEVRCSRRHRAAGAVVRVVKKKERAPAEAI